MAEGFLQNHVPQQSRRDKLRVFLDNQQQTTDQQDGLLPSLIPSHMLRKQDRIRGGGGGGGGSRGEANSNNMHITSYNDPTTTTTTIATSSSSSSSSSPSTSHHHYPYMLDPSPSSSLPLPLPLNVYPSSLQDYNNFYIAQTLPQFDNSASVGEALPINSSTMHMYKPQALSITNDSSSQRLLSLSLSSPHQQQLNLARSNLGCSSTSRGGGGASCSNDIRSAVPLGPFTGYSSILKRSRFLVPAQQMLEDFCDVGQGFYIDRCSTDSLTMDENFNDTGILDNLMACSDRAEHVHHHQKKVRLITLLDEVYKRYKLYFQQMQTIVASFESVAGLGNAAPYTSFALKTMCKHFRCLKDSIIDQLRFSSKSLGEERFNKNETLKFETGNPWVHGQRSAYNSGILERRPVWRPQRGLPERAVSVLRAWLFEHFLHPYPTDTDKQILAKQTGLSRSQVSNWFINARVRLWKPMVEEIHTLETCQSDKGSGWEEHNSSKHNELMTMENPSHSNKQPQTKSALEAQDQNSKRSRTEHVYSPEKVTTESMNFSYNTSPSDHHHIGARAGTSGGNSGVSLTLGLQQNNGYGLSEALPVNLPHRFGLEGNNEGYMIANFQASNQHFNESVGGRLLHDFVG